MKQEVQEEFRPSAWRRLPGCRWLVIEAPGISTCDYRNYKDYMKNLDKLQRNHPEEVPDLESAYKRANREVCSRQTCPRWSNRTGDRFGW